MAYASNRRNFLKTLVGGAAGLSLSRAAFGQEPSAAISATPLADNFVLISGAGGNVLAVNGSEGTLLVDGGLPEHSRELLDVAARQPGAGPVRVLFNTHWHLEHTGVNDMLEAAGAKIIAHENTKLWMGRQIAVQWQDRTYPPRAAKAIPNETFYTSGKMTFGKERVEYGLLFQAHTDGDIFVFFPEPNILMAGDVVSSGSYPVMDWSTQGWIGGMVNASRDLLELTDAETRIIPGHGPIQTRADLEAQFEMLSTVRQRLVEMLRRGLTAREMLAEGPTREFDERWGDPEAFILNAYPGLWGHVRELGGIV